MVRWSTGRMVRWSDARIVLWANGQAATQPSDCATKRPNDQTTKRPPDRMTEGGKMDDGGLTMIEYIILAALILAVVGLAAWQLAGAVAGRLDAYRGQL